MAPHAYEHFGVLVDSVRGSTNCMLQFNGSVRSLSLSRSRFMADPTFRFRHLLPMAIEVQFIPCA